MAYPGQQPGYGAPAYGQPGATGYGAGYGSFPSGGYAGAPAPGYPGVQPGAWGSQQGIDPQIMQWFQSVDVDRSGRITSKELQQALVNANWSQFNPETCRLMIGLFDRDMSGTIDVQEFQALWHYIQQWRSTFERFDSNRSGSIEANELLSATESWEVEIMHGGMICAHGDGLTEAYQQMGFNVSPRFVQTVLYKFDHYGRRSLTLDLFIQSCAMLKSLTDAFKQRDTAMTGTVTLSYEDFMTMAVLYKP